MLGPMETECYICSSVASLSIQSHWNIHLTVETVPSLMIRCGVLPVHRGIDPQLQGCPPDYLGTYLGTYGRKLFQEMRMRLAGEPRHVLGLGGRSVTQRSVQPMVNELITLGTGESQVVTAS